MDITRQNILQDALERFIFRGLQDLTGLVWTTLEKVIGGGAGIRTLDRDKPMLVFKTSAFNRSATPPLEGEILRDLLGLSIGFLGRFVVIVQRLYEISVLIKLP